MYSLRKLVSRIVACRFFIAHDYLLVPVSRFSDLHISPLPMQTIFAKPLQSLIARHMAPTVTTDNPHCVEIRYRGWWELILGVLAVRLIPR
jgi:hypothetical protein